MRIGMRNIKTALSVFLCVAIFQVFNMGSPFYAAIAAIISMQSSVVDSFKTGKNRMLGTLLGAFVGLVFALIGPNNPLLVGLGIMIIIYISNLLSWNKSISIAGVVFIAIMVNLNGKSPLTYSLYRIADTMIGISIAVLINYFISPPMDMDKISERCQTLQDTFSERLKMKLCSGKDINIGDLNNKILSLEEEIDKYKKEFRIKKIKSFEKSSIIKVIGLLNNIFDHLKILDKIQANPSLTKENCDKIYKLLKCTIEPQDEKHDETTLVYNYHVGKILDYLELALKS